MAAWHLLGQGLGAELAALALARAPAAAQLHWAAVPNEDAPQKDASRVLALSPNTVQALAGWGVRLKGRPLAPIRAMHIASAKGFADGVRLAARAHAPIAFTLPLDELRAATAEALKRKGLQAARRLPSAPPQLVFVATRAAWQFCASPAAGRREDMPPSPAGVPRVREFRQQALSAVIEHARPHGHVARQIFLRTGPLALLPLAGKRSALIWTLPAARARALARVQGALFEALLQEQSGDALGRMRLMGTRALAPLAHYQALSPLRLPVLPFGAAAQQVHPLAGLGFNLTVRDIAGLAACLARAHRLGLACDSPSLWRPWWRTRRADAALVGAWTASLNRLFARGTPLRPLAALGLNALGAARRLGRAQIWQDALLAYANRGLG